MCYAIELQSTSALDEYSRESRGHGSCLPHLDRNCRRSNREKSEIRVIRLKLVEKTGTTLKEMLQKSDPFKRQRCGREDCLVCKQAGKGPCNAHGVTYEIECQGCKHKYIGETARNAYTRGTEHTEGLEK